jgi:hypothetical protein
MKVENIKKQFVNEYFVLFIRNLKNFVNSQ